MAALSYAWQLTGFLQEYLQIPRNGYNPDGTLTAACIRQSLQLLLKEEVFDPQELRQQAYKDYGILIPDALMKEV